MGAIVDFIVQVTKPLSDFQFFAISWAMLAAGSLIVIAGLRRPIRFTPFGNKPNWLDRQIASLLRLGMIVGLLAYTVFGLFMMVAR